VFVGKELRLNILCISTVINLALSDRYLICPFDGVIPITEQIGPRHCNFLFSLAGQGLSSSSYTPNTCCDRKISILAVSEGILLNLVDCRR